MYDWLNRITYLEIVVWRILRIHLQNSEILVQREGETKPVEKKNSDAVQNQLHDAMIKDIEQGYNTYWQNHLISNFRDISIRKMSKQTSREDVDDFVNRRIGPDSKRKYLPLDRFRRNLK